MGIKNGIVNTGVVNINMFGQEKDPPDSEFTSGPLVSVIITLWKHENLLVGAVNSVLAQSYPNIEIILVDNNASKRSREVALQFCQQESRRVHLISEPVQGIASARNRGIRESHGEFVAFLDSDDLMHPDRIKIQLETYLSNPEYSIVACQHRLISFDGKIVISELCSPDIQFWARVLFGHEERFKKYPLYTPHPSVMFFRRSTAIDAGLFDESFNPFFTEDTEFCLRMYEKAPIFVVPGSLVDLRMPASEYLIERQGTLNWIGLRNTDRFFKILKKRYFREGDRKIGAAFRSLRSQWIREAASVFLRSAGGTPFGRYLLLRALYLKPLDWKNWKLYLRSLGPRKKTMGDIQDGGEVSSPPEYLNWTYVRSLFN